MEVIDKLEKHKYMASEEFKLNVSLSALTFCLLINSFMENYVGSLCLKDTIK